MSGSVARRVAAVVCLWAALLLPGVALGQYEAFEKVQVELVVGGVGGDTSAQAVQLRFRSDGQHFVSWGRLMAYDADGNNPVELVDLGKNMLNGLQGDRVLITTGAMKQVTSPAVVPDFVMNPIPPSYLDGGRITWECDCSIIYWSLTAGGYVGLNTGAGLNDDDGNFGAPFVDGFPSSGVEGLLFQGGAQDLSTTNVADYALTEGAAVLTNNQRSSFTVTARPAAPSELTGVELMKGVTKLGWNDNSADETNFRIRRQQLIGNVWTNTMFVSTRPANARHYFEITGTGVWRYQVQALNGPVQSAFTPYVKVKPARPTGLAAQPLNGSVQLAWQDGSAFESKFEVERSKYVGYWTTPSIIATLGTDADSHVDAPGSGTYRYRVRAANVGGPSAWTLWVEVTVP